MSLPVVVDDVGIVVFIIKIITLSSMCLSLFIFCLYFLSDLGPVNGGERCYLVNVPAARGDDCVRPDLPGCLSWLSVLPTAQIFPCD